MIWGDEKALIEAFTNPNSKPLMKEIIEGIDKIAGYYHYQKM